MTRLPKPASSCAPDPPWGILLIVALAIVIYAGWFAAPKVDRATAQATESEAPVYLNAIPCQYNAVTLDSGQPSFVCVSFLLIRADGKARLVLLTEDNVILPDDEANAAFLEDLEKVARVDAAAGG